MEISAFIDWLSVTHFGKAEVTKHEALPKTGKVITALNGYTRAIQYSTGAIEMWSPERPKMGIHMVYSGKTLQKIHEQLGVTRDEMLRFHTSTGGRVSRIDFAIDIREGKIDLKLLWDELEAETAKTKSQHSRTQSGGNKGDTVYIGSRKKRKKMVRIYDKAKELGDYVSDFIRCELECRGQVAQSSSRLFQDSGYDAKTILAMVRAFVDFRDVRQWVDVFTSDPLKIPVGTHETGETEKWLLNQVAPSLARVMLDNPDFDVEFVKHVSFYLHKLREERGGV